MRTTILLFFCFFLLFCFWNTYDPEKIHWQLILDDLHIKFRWIHLSWKLPFGELYFCARAAFRALICPLSNPYRHLSEKFILLLRLGKGIPKKCHYKIICFTYRLNLVKFCKCLLHLGTCTWASDSLITNIAAKHKTTP